METKAGMWVVVILAATLGGCASMTPTVATRTSYAVYEVETPTGVTSVQIGEAILGAMRTKASGLQITRGLVPSPLPDTAAKLELVDALKDAGVHEVGATDPVTGKRPVCDGAVMWAGAEDLSKSGYGEWTTYFVCLVPYHSGFHLDTYVALTAPSDWRNPVTFTRSVLGAPGEHVARNLKAVTDAVESTGATTKLIESSPVIN
jgi:hypothetical protein